MISDKDFVELCESGTLGEITQALAAGANPNARDAHGCTALMRAASESNAAVVAALLDAGADKSLKDNDGHDALWHAHESIRDGVRQQRITDPAEREAEEREIIRLLEAEP